MREGENLRGGRGGSVVTNVGATPAVVVKEDRVVTSLHQRAMAAMNAGKDAIKQLLPDVDAALMEAYVHPEGNAERWCKVFELKAILHNHLKPREDAHEEESESIDFGKTLKDYFREACVQRKLDLIKSILNLIKLRQTEKYSAELRVDKGFIKTVLDVCVDSGNFDVVVMIVANFPEEFKDYIASEISKKSPEVALELYGKPEVQRIFNARKNEPAFVVAARVGDVSAVNYCLKSANPPDVNACADHVPALHAAAKNGHEAVVSLLLQAGADINLWHEIGTALWCAMNGNHYNLVVMLLSDKKFDWLKNKCVFDYAGGFLRCSNNNQTKNNIVLLILEKLASNNQPTVTRTVLNGETPLSFAIQADRQVAANLIEKGIGVFDLNESGNAPSYCVSQARDEALMNVLKSYYARHCSEITTLFLNSDPRVCQQLPGQSSCALVLPLVNNWLELKQNVFDEISHRVKNPHTTCAELEKIRDQIKNPKGPLMQFFGIGHGSHFWQSASPWPEKLYPLLDTIKARVAHAYRIVPASNQKK